MNNQTVAHNFYYDLNGKFERRSMSVSYSKGRFWSYATCIAEISETLSGRKICIISDNNFSSTTSKHISLLRAASPFRVVDLPQYYQAQSFNAGDVLNHLKNNLEYYAESKLSQKPNREAFSKYFKMLDVCLELIKFEPHQEDIKELKNQYQGLFDELNSPEKVAEIKEKERAKAVEKAKKLKAELKEYTEKLDVSELARIAYSYNSPVDGEIKSKIKDLINPARNLSFAWFDDDKVRTSQGVTVERKEAETLLKVWNKGRLKHGMTISCYTVLSVTDDEIKIGCHRIPAENFKVLFEKIGA